MKLTVCLLVPLSLLFIALVYISTRNTPNGPAIPTIATASAMLAATSIAMTALTAYANWVRAKKEATIKAWRLWNEETKDDRIAISETIGVNAGLTAEQGRAICDGRPFTAQGRTIGTQRAKELRNRVRRTLSGLERLAVGVEQLVYDRDILMELGGTVVVTTYLRLKAYVTHLQHHPEEARRRPLAYKAIEALVVEVESEEGRAHRQLFDVARVRRIQQITKTGPTLDT